MFRSNQHDRDNFTRGFNDFMGSLNNLANAASDGRSYLSGLGNELNSLAKEFGERQKEQGRKLEQQMKELEKRQQEAQEKLNEIWGKTDNLFDNVDNLFGATAPAKTESATQNQTAKSQEQGQNKTPAGTHKTKFFHKPSSHPVTFNRVFEQYKSMMESRQESNSQRYYRICEIAGVAIELPKSLSDKHDGHVFIQPMNLPCKVLGMTYDFNALKDNTQTPDTKESFSLRDIQPDRERQAQIEAFLEQLENQYIPTLTNGI